MIPDMICGMQYVNANAANESVLVQIDANAKAIELTKGFDVPTQIGSKRDIPIHIQDLRNLSLNRIGQRRVGTVLG